MKNGRNPAGKMDLNHLHLHVRNLGRAQRLYADSAATLEQVQNAETAFNVADESFRIAGRD